jgi:hypothetical protein
VEYGICPWGSDTSNKDGEAVRDHMSLTAEHDDAQGSGGSVMLCAGGQLEMLRAASASMRSSSLIVARSKAEW